MTEFRTELGVLRVGDALKLLKEVPDESVDLILTDPPYNVSKPGQNITRKGGKFGVAKDIKLDFGEWDRGIVKWQDFIEDFVRVLKPTGVLVMFYDRLELGCIGKYLQEEHGFQVRHIGAWVKSNPAPQARKVQWQNGLEFFIVATKNKGSGHHFNYKLGQSPDYFIHSVNFKHYHPTQKPLKLIEWIMSYWSFRGDLVLDPFAGSGTTLVAAERLGRRWIGFEINPEYAEIAMQRIRAEQYRGAWQKSLGGWL